MDESYPKTNQTSADRNGKRWMTVEELEYDANLIREVGGSLKGLHTYFSEVTLEKNYMPRLSFLFPINYRSEAP